MPDGQVVIEIQGDKKPIDKALRETTSSIQSESKKWDAAAADSANNMQSSLVSAFKSIAGAAATAKIGKALLDFGADAISAASDLREVQNVVDVTFGDGAAQIEAWAKKAQSQFGLTETQAKRFTSTLGAMMKSSGLAGDEIVGMSTDLAGLAADMSSFYNLDFDTAFQKIRAGISGETEPLKQLGINMSVANLEAYALTQGITKSFDQMSQGEQVMLRYQYLMQATADAQGDFSRTADGYANAQRRIQTAIDSIKTSAGNMLMNVVEPLTSGFASFLENLTATPERTVMDEFADIDANTAAKMAEITKTADDARALVGILNDIQTQQVSNASLTGFVEELSSKISGLDSAMTKAKSGDYAGTLSGIASAMELKTGVSADKWSTLLTAVSANLPGATDATDSDDEKTAKWLQAAGDAAASLGGDYPELWEQFMETLGSDTTNKALSYMAGGQAAADAMKAIGIDAKGLDGSEQGKWSGLLGVLTTADPTKGLFGSDAASAAANIGSLSTALSSNDPATKKQAWSEMLGILSSNIDGVAELSKQSPEDTKAWLEGLAASADKIDPNDPKAWDELFGTLLKGLPGLEDTEIGQAFLNNLKTLATDSNLLNASSSSNWEKLLTALNDADTTKGIFGANAAERITAMADALANGDPTAKKEAWSEMLGVLSTNADSIAKLTGKSVDEVKQWFSDLEDAVPETGEDLNAWNVLLTELASGFTTLDKKGLGSEFLGSLKTVAEDSNVLDSSAPGNWKSLLETLNSADATQGIFGTDAADKISAFSQALSGNDPSAKKRQWSEMLGILSENADSVAKLTGQSTEDVEKWFRELSEKTPEAGDNIKEWDALLTSLAEGLAGVDKEGLGDGFLQTLEQIDQAAGGTGFFASLMSGFMGIEQESSNAEKALRGLGIDTEGVADKQAMWLKVCKDLVKTIPGLSSIIDTNTGEIKGGIDAVNDYINEWENANKKMIAMQALQKKEEALAAKRVQMVDYWLEYKTAKSALEQFEAEHAKLAKTLREQGMLGVKDSDDKDKRQYMALLATAKETKETYEGQAKAVDEAEDKMKAYRQVVEDMPGDVDKFTDSTESASQATKEFTASQKEAETAIKNATNALDEVNKYYERNRDSIRKTIEGLGGAFGSIETPAQKAQKEIQNVQKAIKDAKTDSERNSLQIKLEGAGEAVQTINKITNGLKSQISWYQEYSRMMSRARELGYSDDVLAQLADGSAESFDYLTALTDQSITANDARVAEVNKLFAESTAEVKKLSDELNDTALKTDEAFQSLVQSATDAVNSLNLEEQSKGAMEQTVQGIANGIAVKIPAVQAQVDKLNSVLNQLNSTGKFGFSFSTGLRFGGSGGLIAKPDGSNANGLDYVPFDNYLSILHEGETVLTAEEARVWRNFKAGGMSSRNTIDYDALGAAMRDNVHAGGNVYLNGRTVGRVISDIQADSYRSMERSGFQQ